MALDSLGDWERTHDCGTLGADDTGSRVALMGWVQRRRDHGGLIVADRLAKRGELVDVDPDR